MRIALFTLMCLAAPLVLGATVYKWVDENGVVHYSDQPHPNAEKVHVQAVQTYKAGTAPPTDGIGGGGPSGAPQTGYAGCAVSAPADTRASPTSSRSPSRCAPTRRCGPGTRSTS